MNPFETLGLEPTFQLSTEMLSERQRDLSKALHPDKFVGRPAGERREALSRAIAVNEAYRILRNPLTRAEALLQHLGLALAEGTGPAADPLLLMEMMERREELREAGRSGEAAQVERLSAAVGAEAKALSQELGVLFEAAQKEPPQRDSEAFSKIHRLLGAMRFYARFLDEANAYLDEIG